MIYKYLASPEGTDENKALAVSQSFVLNRPLWDLG